MDIQVKNTLYRDKKFDGGIYWLFLLIGGIFLLMVVPMVTAYAIATIEHRTLATEYGVSPSAALPQEAYQDGGYMSSYVIIIIMIFCVVSTYYFVRSFSIGNKYKVYLINENGELYYTHIGEGEIYNYYKRTVTIKERVKASPNILYLVLSRVFVNRFVRKMNIYGKEQFFQYNMKYQMAEQLLTGKNYKNYCNPIVAVKRIKFFNGGCTVAFSTMAAGLSEVETCNIYSSMEGFQEVVDKLLALYQSGGARITNKDRRIYDTMEKSTRREISAYELAQVRRQILRKNRVGIVLLFTLLLLMLWDLFRMMELAGDIETATHAWTERGYIWLMARAKRRIGLGLGYIPLGLLSVAKGIFELIQAGKFTVKAAEVQSYHEKQGNKIKKFMEVFPYYAEAEFEKNGSMIEAPVGVGKNLYDNREFAEPVLVMKRNEPYMLVMK